MMTETLEFKQRSDLDLVLRDPATRLQNADRLTGHWLNTDADTQGVAEVFVEQNGDVFSVRLIGVGNDGPIKWPRADARVLANLDEEGGQRAIALTATFDFGFMQAETCVRVNKGVLVLLLFNAFRDDSRRSNYVTREFYYRENRS